MSEDEDGFRGFPSMDLFIETLTGTCFEMRVYPTDTILDIKNKIQRVEGIPVHHQNLLFRLKEVDDHARLCDLGIVTGSTLKLVLAMRGGPISTRRLSSCDHHVILKDLKDLIEHTRDELGEQLGPGSKVSVLVFKDGDVINLIRVIENDDGSYQPYHEKSTPTSKITLKEATKNSFYNKMQENNSTLAKVTDLRKKMSNSSQKRQTKNWKTNASSSFAANTLVEEDLNDLNNPPGSSCGARRVLNYNLSYKLLDDKKKDPEQPPAVKDDKNVIIALKEKHRGNSSHMFVDAIRPESLIKSSTDSILRPRYMVETTAISRSDFKHEDKVKILDETVEEKIINSSILTPLYNRLSPPLRHDNVLPDISCDLDISSHSGGSSIAESIAILEEEESRSDEKEILSPFGTPCVAPLSLSNVASQNTMCLSPLLLQNNSDRPKSTPDTIDIEENAQEICDIFAREHADRFRTNQNCKLGLLKRWQSLECTSDDVFAPSNSVNGVKMKTDKEHSDSCKNSMFDENFYSRTSAVPTEYRPKDEHGRDKYFGSHITEEAVRRSPLYRRNSHGFAAQPSLTVNSGDMSRNSNDLGGNLGNLSSAWNNFGATSREKIQNPGNKNCPEILNIPLSGALLNLMSESYRKSKDSGFAKHTSMSAEMKKPYDVSQLRLGKSSQNLENSARKFHIEATKLENLPAVITKKHMRCAQCNKRLNITNIYDCRCGGIFCAQHRYSEVHGCKYDYKTEGRKLLQQQNPLVVAEKLPKL